MLAVFHLYQSDAWPVKYNDTVSPARLTTGEHGANITVIHYTCEKKPISYHIQVFLCIHHYKMQSTMMQHIKAVLL